jgi:hypothetical protein
MPATAPHLIMVGEVLQSMINLPPLKVSPG